MKRADVKQQKKRRRFKKRWLIIPLAIILVLTVGTGVYGYSVWNQAKDTVNTKMHEPVNSIDVDKTKDKVEATEKLNVLVLGADARGSDRGRSDALMVLSLDPKEDAMQIVSIPRDTRTTIAGRGEKDKINHAYAFGGTDMAVDTVEQFLDIELDYYVRLDMEGLKQLVDTIGPITIDNDIAWSNGQYDFPEGTVQMNGDKTMKYVRMRKQDPNGDFGRTQRQRKVVEAIIDRGATAGSVTKIHNMIDILGETMSTNMDFDDMKHLFTGYKDTRHHMDTYMMQGTGTKIGGIYYMTVTDEEIAKVHDLIKQPSN